MPFSLIGLLLPDNTLLVESDMEYSTAFQPTGGSPYDSATQPQCISVFKVMTAQLLIHVRKHILILWCDLDFVYDI